MHAGWVRLVTQATVKLEMGEETERMIVVLDVQHPCRSRPCFYAFIQDGVALLQVQEDVRVVVRNQSCDWSRRVQY